MLKKFLESHKKPKKELKWPDEIKNIIQKPINHLWVNELFYTPAPPNGSLKEFEILSRSKYIFSASAVSTFIALSQIL